MKKFSKEDLQTALNVLVAVHESPEALEKMKAVCCLNSISQTQGSVAENVRFLMRLRDGEIKIGGSEE